MEMQLGTEGKMLLNWLCLLDYAAIKLKKLTPFLFMMKVFKMSVGDSKEKMILNVPQIMK